MMSAVNNNFRNRNTFFVTKLKNTKTHDLLCWRMYISFLVFFMFRDDKIKLLDKSILKKPIQLCLFLSVHSRPNLDKTLFVSVVSNFIGLYGFIWAIKLVLLWSTLNEVKEAQILINQALKTRLLILVLLDHRNQMYGT